MAELLCVECLGPATIQFVDEHGMPIGTLCAECDASYQKMHDQISQLLSDAVRDSR
jgi:hypothetical protein